MSVFNDYWILKEILVFSSIMRAYFLLTLGLLGLSSFAQTPRLFYEHHKFSALSGNVSVEMPEKGHWGSSAIAVGDVDQDGIIDLATAAPDDSLGSLWILFMESDSSIRESRKLGASDLQASLTKMGGFGLSLEALGDWDGDSIPDLAVGEPYGKLGPLDYGKVWLIMLNRDGSVKKSLILSGRTPGLIRKLNRESRFGADIHAVGDLNQDGTKDLLVGAPGNPAKGTGKTWRLFLNADGSVKEAVSLFPTDKKGLSLLERGVQFGTSLESYVDENRIYLLIGAPLDDDAGVNAGALWWHELGTDKWAKWVPGQNTLLLDVKNEDRWGSGIAVLNDLNQDSIPEI
ncbi:MAG: hypothetical protein AAF206_17920, partial [Bacteroidota bacterium]